MVLKNLGRIILHICCLVLMILMPKIALNSASTGLNLCIKSVIPGLFPFLFLSSYIASEINGYSIPLLERITKIPKGTAGYFLIGQLCGYPVGAKLLQSSIDDCMISKTDAVRMMSFCNNASPAFIIGVLTSVFSSGKIAIIMLAVQFCASVILGVLLPPSIDKTTAAKKLHTSKDGNIMQNSLKTIAVICGWIILFAVIIGYVDEIFLSQANAVKKAFIFGMFELTNGCNQLYNTHSLPLRFIISAILLSLGGICVWVQTNSLAKDINIKKYVFHRFIHASISGTLASVVSLFLFSSAIIFVKTLPLFLCATAIFMLILYFNKKW